MRSNRAKPAVLEAFPCDCLPVSEGPPKPPPDTLALELKRRLASMPGFVSLWVTRGHGFANAPIRIQLSCWSPWLVRQISPDGKTRFTHEGRRVEIWQNQDALRPDGSPNWLVWERRLKADPDYKRAVATLANPQSKPYDRSCAQELLFKDAFMLAVYRTEPTYQPGEAVA